MRLILVALALILSANSALSDELVLGVSPGRIAVRDMLPGQILERETLVSSHGTADLQVQIETSGAPWVETDEAVTVPAQGGITIPLRIHVPESALAGTYQSQLFFRARMGKGSVSPELVIPLTLSYTVTERAVKNLSVRRMSLVSHDEDLIVVLDVENLGNIADTPQSVQVELRSVSNPQRTVTLRPTDFASVRAFERRNLSIRMPVTLPPGDYWASVTLALTDTIVSDTVMIEVLPDENRALRTADALWIWIRRLWSKP
jgi:uncharacterized membrane protein